METWSTHHLYQQALGSLGAESAVDIRLYAQQLISKRLPVIFTLGHLAKITGVSYQMVHTTVSRRRESSNYKMYPVGKRSGGRRFIHAVNGGLFTVQRFINQEILQKCHPHSSSFAFHPSGGIRNCAAMHCGAKWLFQFDLTEFFYDITEIDVYGIFEGLGYRALLAFELARLCTTTRLPRHKKQFLGHRDFYRWMPRIAADLSDRDSGLSYHKGSNLIGVLPQGAPTSPMLSNLAARGLDASLHKFAVNNGFVYTRYADDITISASAIPGHQSVGKIFKSIVSHIRGAGFKENDKKTRIAGPGSKKVVLGLLVDAEQPRLSKETYRRIDRHLYASAKFGLPETASHEGFDSAFGFFNHLSGLIAFVKDVDPKRWENFSSRFSQIETPWSQY